MAEIILKSNSIHASLWVYIWRGGLIIIRNLATETWKIIFRGGTNLDTVYLVLSTPEKYSSIEITIVETTVKISWVLNDCVTVSVTSFCTTLHHDLLGIKINFL